MLFNSLGFIFLFLPAAILLFHITRLMFPGRDILLIGLLLVLSLFFYGYWNPDYLWLLSGSILFNFVIGRQIRHRPSKYILSFGICVNVACLAYFKYTGFITSELSFLFDSGWSAQKILLPLAISFFTFQQIAYLVDCYRGRAEEDGGILQFALFVSFFPQLIAGPIVRHADVATQFRNRLAQSADLRLVSFGAVMFITGLFKKVVIADSVAPVADSVFSLAETGTIPSLLEAWAGVIAFSLQIYFDFSGYTDMALGIAAMFGIILPMNFTSPYKATGIIEFWRRWHMTLSSFLRDYIYFPLGGGRSGPARRYANLLIVMLIGGIWHGAGWNFMLWGLCHGLMLSINHGWRYISGGVSDNRLSQLAGWTLTFLAVCLAWVLFRADSLSSALAVYQGLGGIGGIELPSGVYEKLVQTGIAPLFSSMSPVHWDTTRAFQTSDIAVILSGLFCCLALPRADQLRDRFNNTVQSLRSFRPGLFDSLSDSVAAGVITGAGISLLFWAAVILTNRERAFLYFQF